MSAPAPGAGGRRRAPGLTVDWHPRELPAGTGIDLRALETTDGSAVRGTLYTPPGDRSPTVIVIMHPRVDMSRHYLIPGLVAAGHAVWAQTSRDPNNDLRLVHERTLLDLAAGMRFVRSRGHSRVVALGNSGGAGLMAFYAQQSTRPGDDRLSATPAGRPTGLAAEDMPPFDAMIFLAPHPGQGALLQACIDPSVTDEADPLSVAPELNPFDPANGFAAPPESSSYSPSFVKEYRAAQVTRVRRIDERARRLVAAAAGRRARARRTGDPADQRSALAPAIMTIYRTDADLRCTDLSIDRSDRSYGSVFGRRPDLTNYGTLGFGRLATPEAWLSTWSGQSSNAVLAKTASEIAVPVLVVSYTGDSTVFPTDIDALMSTLTVTDKTHVGVRGDHYGRPLGPGEPPGAEAAATHILDWLGA